MFLVGFPLLLIPFVLYNIFAFIFGITDWNAAARRPSGLSRAVYGRSRRATC